MENNNNNTLGNNICERRKQKGISQYKLAEIVGVTRQTVSKWEAGIVAPKMDKLYLICEALDIELDYLMPKSNDAQDLSDVAADNIAQVCVTENVEKNDTAQIREEKQEEVKNCKSSKKTTLIKIAIAAIVILLLFAITILVCDKIFAAPEPEGTIDTVVSVTWNFSAENIGWIMFGVSVGIGCIWGISYICKAVMRKIKAKNLK